MAETQNRQVPWESSSLTSDFSTPKDEAGGGPAVPVAQGQIDREALFWQNIKDSGNREDFEEYLRQFPDGLFRGLARKWLEALSSASGRPSDTRSPRYVHHQVRPSRRHRRCPAPAPRRLRQRLSKPWNANRTTGFKANAVAATSKRPDRFTPEAMWIGTGSASVSTAHCK